MVRRVNTMMLPMLCVVLVATLTLSCSEPEQTAGGSEGTHGAVTTNRQETPPAPPEKVNSATFKARQAARTISLTGFTRARTTLALVSEEEGRCVEAPVDVGEVIGEDGVFARLDTTFIKLDLARNRAEQARVASNVDFYGKERGRYKDLVKRDTASQSTLDSHVRSHASSSQELRGLRIEGQRLAERLKRFTFNAPSGWRVVSRQVEEGQWVTKGQTIGHVGNYNALIVPFALSLNELESLQNKAEAIVLALPELNATATAEVLRVAPDYDPDTRKVNVDLVIREGKFKFRGGIRAELTIDLPDPGGSVTVPASALVRAYEDYFLVRPDGVRIKVLLLGSGGDGSRRVSSEEVSPGDIFLLNPGKG